MTNTTQATPGLHLLRIRFAQMLRAIERQVDRETFDRAAVRLAEAYAAFDEGRGIAEREDA